MAARRLLVCLVALVALATCYALAQEGTELAARRVIEMTAANYEFAPSSVHVKVGETVRLSITATDKAHGVRIKPIALGSPEGSAPGLQITPGTDCVKFKKKGTGTIDFAAQSPGTYEFECCKLCGFGHGKMKGEIIVDPS
jgi:heme/copper-type cytochrome/quinol oxidase subunit 2